MSKEKERIKKIKKSIELFNQKKAENDRRTMYMVAYLCKENIECYKKDIVEVLGINQPEFMRYYENGMKICTTEFTKTEIKKIIKLSKVNNDKGIYSFLNKVQDFRKAFDLPIREEPTLIPKQEAELNFKLLNEENLEYLDAVEDNDLVEVYDALIDEFYIWCGKVISHGLQKKIVQGFNEVHESNMSKLDENGKAIKRADGKVMKGENYFKPELSKIIE